MTEGAPKTGRRGLARLLARGGNLTAAALRCLVAAALAAALVPGGAVASAQGADAAAEAAVSPAAEAASAEEGLSVQGEEDAAVSTWDGVSVDVAWYCENAGASDYYISTAAELAGLSALVGGAVTYDGEELGVVDFYGATVHLTADIDLGGANEEPAYWTPIGCYTTKSYSVGSGLAVFAGSFDGGGHTIYNLLVGEGATARLHGQVTSSGLFGGIHGIYSSTGEGYTTVSDLRIVGACVGQDSASAKEAYVGALAGFARAVHITNVQVVGGAVDGGECGYVGGIVGHSIQAPSFVNCSNSATVTAGGDYVGGIVGYISSSGIEKEITGCVNTGAVSGGNYTGGLVGYTTAGYDVGSCFNTGTVEVYGSYGGGLFGGAGGTMLIGNCYNVGTVESKYWFEGTDDRIVIGGIAGVLYSGNSWSRCSVVVDCYNAASVTATGLDEDSEADQFVGGLFGCVGTLSTYGLNRMSAIESNFYASDIDGAPSCGIGVSRDASSYDDCSQGLTADGYQAATLAEMCEEDFIGNFTEVTAYVSLRTDPYYVTVEPDYVADYEGEATLNGGLPLLTWQTQEDISLAAEVAAIADQVFTGEAVEPDVTVTLDGETLAADTDYTLSYSDNVAAGTAGVVVTGAGAYRGSVAATFQITPASVEAPTAAEGLVYTGQEQAGVAGTSLYAVEGGSATDAGGYTALVSLVDAASSSWADGTTDDLEIGWSIARATPSVSVSVAEDGTPVAEVVGVDGAIEGAEVTFAYYADAACSQPLDAAPTGAGTYYVTATYAGSGNYEAATSEPAVLSIEGAAEDADDGSDGTGSGGTDGSDGGSDGTSAATKLAAANVTLSYAKTVYTGKKLTPAVTVKVNGAKLARGTDYTVSYSGNKSIGKAKVTVKGKGSYTGTVTKTFKIVPRKATLKSATKSKVKKKIAVKWKKVAGGVTKYQVRYRVKGAKKWKSVTVKASKRSITLKKLKSGKRYQVQVRACKTVSGARYLGAWSKAKTVKVK